ncbi:MAG: hypothetical protein J6U19_07820, partial [Oscillospiraceae bacterium]|nr:hypothetical protein [Oscillospiraceae bacterium]
MSPVFTALMIPFLGTALGSAFVFFMKRDMPQMLQKVLLGFASGVMVAASVWSLIIPAIEMGEGAAAVVPPVIGLLAGFAFLLLATSILGIMPYMLAFAAGAMLYVVVEELVPDYSQGKHSNIGTIGFAL